MSELVVASEERRTPGPEARPYTLVKLEGFIDAANYLVFENALDKLVRAHHVHIVLDFRKVQYINSTGISAIIRFQSACAERGGQLILIQVSRNVGLTMHLLGITSLVAFLKDRDEAEAALEKGGTDVATSVDFEAGGDGVGRAPRQIPVLVESHPDSGGCAVLVVPKEGPFTNIISRRVAMLKGRFHLCHDTDTVLTNLQRWQPDLVILDHRITGIDRFVERLKIESDLPLTSVIVLYPRGAEVTKKPGFRIWENDYLLDPFDLMKLFVLAETELRRVPKDRNLFSQQVKFEFPSIRESMEKGLQLGNRLLQKLDVTDADRTALYAAFKEGVENAASHGNRFDPKKRVIVTFVVDPNRATFVIQDEGEGFDHTYYMSQIDSKEAFERAKERIRAGNRGGLGILLMHKCSDRLEYSGRGNVVRIEKNLD
jgi:anti-anti-sigma factor